MNNFRKNPIKTMFAAIFISLTFIGVGNVDAASVFNPGRIIDDGIFTNSGSMNPGSIQSFLNTKGASCSNGEAPCLKNFAEGGRSAAQIIYDTSQEFRINPQVLIVTLQKETGLVTVNQPANWRYRTATGYGCPDSTPGVCDANYYGFTNQTKGTARMFRKIMDNVPQSEWYTPYVLGNNSIRWHPNTSCGSSIVNIENRATQALYNYTPYRPNQAALEAGWGQGDGCSSYGNRNFYLWFTDWFGTTIIGQYPSPLYKSAGSSDIYAIANNTKYKMVNFAVINAFGLLDAPVTIVTDAYLSNLTTGPAITSSIAKKAQDPSGTLYMFDDGKRYPIGIQACKENLDGSPVANSTWKIDCFNSGVVSSLPNSLIDNFSRQDINIPNVILYDNSAWKIEDGKKRRITNPAFIDVLGGWGNVRWMKDINATQSLGKLLIPANSVVKFSGSDAIYLMTYTKLLPINSLEDFIAWGLNKLPVYSLPASFNTTDPLDIGTPITSIARDVPGNYFLINFDGKRTPLISGQTDWSTTTATTNADVYLNTMTTMSPTGVYRSTGGTIFVIENSKKRVIATTNDFSALGFVPGHLINITAAADASLMYDGLKLSHGRLFKVSGSDTIRYVNSANGSLQVNSPNHPGLPYGDLITVDATTGAKYPITGTYTP